MKKTLLLGAAILAAMTMNATTWNFSTVPGEFTPGSGSDATTIAPADGEDLIISAMTVSYDAAAAGTVENYDGLGFFYKNSGGATKKGFRFYSTQGGYLQIDGGDVTTLIYDCVAGEKITVTYSSKNTNSVVATELVDGKGTATLDETFPTNITLDEEDAEVASANTEDIVVAHYTVTNSGTVALKSKGGYRIFTIVKGEEDESALHNVSIAEKISFNGSVISNAEGLNVFVYNALGKLVANSNGNINMDSFQSGVYLVRAEGIKNALKIRK